ncbi:FUSC family protein, partial [Achromobacter sp. Marseille-Q0513]|uniref:FUSC family protein n=1 Tax=Achromobacter sp. Marseille-Q0513 TaxID=2829161 RepID=UPI001B8EB380
FPGRQRRLLRMVPLLSAAESYSALWPAEGSAALAAWKEAVAARARAGEPADDALLEQGRRAMPAGHEQPWAELTRHNFVSVAADALQLWAEIRQIQAHQDSGQALPARLARKVRDSRPFPLWPDVRLALRVSGGILLAYAALCGLWWATGWTQGANAVLMGAVALAFFGNVDEAGKAIGAFLRFSALGLALAGVLSYGLLPWAQNYEMFLAVMALVMLPIGAWAASTPLAILLLALALSNVNLQAVYAPRDFAAFLEACCTTLLGICAGQWSIGIVRDMGAAQAVERLARQERDDVRALARGGEPQARDNYTNRALDRIASITSRRPVDGDGSVRLLSGLRAGVAISVIRETGAGAPGGLREACEALLDEVRRARGEGVPPQLLARIDEALSAAWRAGAAAPGMLVRGLVGLRVALFERSQAWVPAG